MILWQQLGRVVSPIHVSIALNVLAMLLLPSSAQDTSQQVMYVTGCLGSDAVLHRPTLEDDIRAVFAYKGGEILGSDIIPAQGDYKGRLEINRQGEVTLSNLMLWDSGVYRVEMTRRDRKTSTYVVLVVPDAPTTQHYGLRVLSDTSPAKRDQVRLTCGTFTSLGYPQASVLWQDPDGRQLSSTGYANGQFYLDLPVTSRSGNYTCFLHCGQSHSCCLPPASPLLRHAHEYIELSTPRKKAPEISPEMTSALQKTGEDMAVAMAALVNGQVHTSLLTTQQHLQAWKEEMERNMEERINDIKNELESTVQRQLERANNTVSDIISGRYHDHIPTTPSPQIDSNRLRRIEMDVYNKMEDKIRTVYERMDEGQRNVSIFQRKLNHKINVFQKRLKTMRLTLKRSGVDKHSTMIKELIDDMSEQFKEVNRQIRDLEAANPLSDEEVRRFQQQFSDVKHRLSQGERDFGSFQTSMTNTVRTLQTKMTLLETQVDRQAERLVTVRPPVDADAGNVNNNTNSIVGGTERHRVSPRKDYTFGERGTPGTNYGDQYGGGGGGGGLSPSVNSPVSENCLGALHKGGTVTGAYTLRPDGLDSQSFWCDQTSDGGGWLVFQRRRDGSEEFYRPWKDYQTGFGAQNSNGEFWLGLEKLHLITSGERHSLRVDLRTFDGVEAYAFYDHFRVLGTHQEYLMTVDGYSGTAGDGLFVHDNMAFSTWDEDNDHWADGHCAANYRSAWWYAGCRICDLNAPYTRDTKGIMWLYGDSVWGPGNIAFVEMKIRPVH